MFLSEDNKVFHFRMFFAFRRTLESSLDIKEVNGILNFIILNLCMCCCLNYKNIQCASKKC